MTKKKFTQLLAVLITLAFTAAACGGSGSAGSSTEKKSEDSTSDSSGGGNEGTGEKQVLSGVLRSSDNFCELNLKKPMEELVVGFSQVASDGAWRVAETESMEAQEERVSKLIVTDAQNDTAKQVRDLQDLVNQEVDVILLAPRESDGLDEGLEAAKQAGIPVLFVDRSHEGEPCEDFQSFVSSDFVEQARIAGQRLAEATDGKAKIIQLEGTAGSDVAVDRKNGFDEIIDQNPDMEILASQTADFNRAEGQQVMSKLLQTHPDVTAVYAHNDEMALGAITALEAAGRQPGVDVTVVSIDGTKDAFAAIKEGKLLLTVESNPRFGPIAFDIIEGFSTGRSIPDRVVIEDRVFDESNAEEFEELGF